MEVLYGEKLQKTINRIVMQCMQGGFSVFVSPYISDFKPWGNLKGAKMKEGKSYLTELFISNTLEEDDRIVIITDKDSKNRRYSKGIIKEIEKRRDAQWIYIFEIDKLHAKLFLNNRIAVIGSSNLTYKALKKNIELGVVFTNNDRNIINSLKEFAGDLIIKSDPLNLSAKRLKSSLKKQKILKKETIFNIIELIAHSHYLYRTTEILCIQESFKRPSILKRLEGLLNKFDTETKDVKKYAKTFRISKYDSLHDSLLLKKWNQEEFKIKQKQIKDTLKIWDKYFSGKISKPVYLYKLLNKNYINPIKSSRVITIRHNEDKAIKFVAELIEERIKKRSSSGF